MSRQSAFILFVFFIQIITQFLSIQFEYINLYKIISLICPALFIGCGLSCLLSDKCYNYWTKKIKLKK